jgi:hypothetical protein
VELAQPDLPKLAHFPKVFKNVSIIKRPSLGQSLPVREQNYFYIHDYKIIRKYVPI